MTNDWQQISGDVTASEYGATFGQLDTIGDRVYGVNVVEIFYMPAHIAYEGQHPYCVETHYCDVDNVELSRMRSFMSYTGWLKHENEGTPEYPESVQERVAYLQACLSDYHKMYEWQGFISDEQAASERAMNDELDTLRQWYAIPRMVRAEAMASYGGCETDSYQTREYKTLARAMQSEGIPREALWHPSEYDEIPDDVEAGNGTRLNITVPHGSYRRLDGVDSDGAVWNEYDMRGYLDMYDDGNSTCTGCGEKIESHCWHDETGTEQYCPDCVDWNYGNVTLPA